MRTFDYHFERQTVIDRLSRGSAFSLLWITGHSRAGVYDVRGFALDPLNFVELAGRSRLGAKIAIHHFSGQALSERAFIEECPVSEILGQIEYRASVVTEFDWARGNTVEANTEFKKCLVVPDIVSETIGNGEYMNTRNESMFPIFRPNASTITQVREVVTREAPILIDGWPNPNVDRNPQVDVTHTFRTEKSPTIYQYYLSPRNTARMSLEVAFQYLAMSITFCPSGLNNPRLLGRLGDRMVGNQSSAFIYENASVTNAPVYGGTVTGRTSNTHRYYVDTPRKPKPTKPTTPPLPVYDQFNRTRDI